MNTLPSNHARFAYGMKVVLAFLLLITLLPLHTSRAASNTATTYIPRNSCADKTNSVEQLQRTSFYSDANPVYASAGQSFTVPTGVTEADGITAYFGFIEADSTITLNLYDGPASGDIGSPIATAAYVNSGPRIDAQPGSDLEISFEFNSPVSLTEGNEYYYLLSPSFDPVAFSYAFASDNPYAGGSALSGYSNGTVGSWSYDLKFAVYSCNDGGGGSCETQTSLFDQLQYNSTAQHANPSYASAGQSFTVPTGITEADGITAFFSFIAADSTITLSLYDGPASGSIGSPIATATYTNAGDRIDAPFGSALEIPFIFDNPISLTPSNVYYYLLSPSYDPVAFGFSIADDNPYAGGTYLSGGSNGTVSSSPFPNWDLPFSVFLCDEGGSGESCVVAASVIEQLQRTSFYSDANPVYESAGQSFTVPNGVTEIDGITAYFGFIEAASTITLNLYNGPASGSIGAPIATATYTNAGDRIDAPPNSDLAIAFAFDNPVTLTPSNEYYYLLSPSFDPVAFSYAFASGNPYAEGSALSGYSNGTVGAWSYDLKFSIYVNEDCPTSDSAELSPGETGSLSVGGSTGRVDVNIGANSLPPESPATTLELNSNNTPNSPVPGNLQFAGVAFDLDAYQSGQIQESFSFNEADPPQVVITYSDADIIGLDESLLELCYYDVNTGTWRLLGITVVSRDPDNNVLIVTVDHLTEFALFEVSTPTAVGLDAITTTSAQLPLIGFVIALLCITLLLTTRRRWSYRH